MTWLSPCRKHKHTASRTRRALRRQVRGRKKISGTAERPRLVVTRSSKHITAQVVDDLAGKTLVSASTMEADLRTVDGDKTAKAKQVGELVAERAKTAGVEYGRLRPRRQQVPRPDRGARRRRPRGRAGLLMARRLRRTTADLSRKRTSDERSPARTAAVAIAGGGRDDRRGGGARRATTSSASSRSTGSPRSSRVVVASASPPWSSSVTATASSASATARPRRCRPRSPRASRRPRRPSSASPASRAPSRTRSRVRRPPASSCCARPRPVPA